MGMLGRLVRDFKSFGRLSPDNHTYPMWYDGLRTFAGREPPSSTGAEARRPAAGRCPSTTGQPPSGGSPFCHGPASSWYLKGVMTLPLSPACQPAM